MEKDVLPVDYLLKKFLPRIEFDSYEDFKANYKVNVPENFNFGFDVVTPGPKRSPRKRPWSGAMRRTTRRISPSPTSSASPTRPPISSKAWG